MTTLDTARLTIRKICLTAVGEAEAAIVTGFKTKRAQQDVLDRLSRAYDKARAQITGDCLLQRIEDGIGYTTPEPFQSLYWGLPDNLVHWGAKHAAAVVAAFPQHEDLVSWIGALLTARNAVKAQPIAAKPTEKPLAKVDGRPIYRTEVLGHPVGKVVLPLRFEAEQAAVDHAKVYIGAVIGQLAKHDHDLYAAYPVDRDLRHTARGKAQRARRDGAQQLVTGDPARRYSGRPGDPYHVVLDIARCERFIQQAREQAAALYDAFVAKLVGKIGPCLTASLEGNHVWGHSVLTVTKADGSVERWQTRQIVNHSVYGLAFNQWPSRLVK